MATPKSKTKTRPVSTETSEQWYTQRSRRAKGWYYQAVHGRGQHQRVVTLGYLSDGDADAVLARLRAQGEKLLVCQVPTGFAEPDPTVEGMFCTPGLSAPLSVTLVSHRCGVGTPIMTDAEIRRFALDEAPELVEQVVAELRRADVDRAMSKGDYGKLSLKDFHDRLWWPTRSTEAAASTVRREGEIWPVILDVLGHVRMENLDTLRWQGFLTSRTTWSGRTRAICQNAYRLCLNFAEELGAIEAVHKFRDIKGATEITLPKADALTPDEVVRLLDATIYPVHRALFAFLFGQGPRPGEAVAMRWEMVDWNKGTVLIPGTKTRGSKAVVPMTALTKRELTAYWESLGRPEEGAMFLYRGEPIAGRFRVALVAAAKRAGLLAEGRKVTQYSGRVTFATTGVVAGVNQGAMRAMMRHTVKSVILERAYERLRVEQVADALDVFPSFEGPTKG